MVAQDIILLIALTYAVSISAGYLMEKKVKIPWMFAALFFGIFLSALGLFKDAIQSESFQTFASLGLLFLLFLIGFNFRPEKIRRLRTHILRGTAFIITLEGVLGTLLLYLAFPAEVSGSLVIAAITAFSFATVGEVVLLPILKEFKVLSTAFGQLTLGIGTFDDVIEILLLVLVTNISLLPVAATAAQNVPPASTMLATLGGLGLASVLILKARRAIRSRLQKVYRFHYVHYLLLLVLFFSFVAAGQFVFEGLAPISAILAGLVARQLFPRHISYENEKALNFLGYIFLAPLFFLSIGAEVSIPTLFLAPLLIAAIYAVSKGSKLLASFLMFRKLLGAKYSLLMGLGLSVRFSTSLIVQFLLFQAGLITLTLFSALIATAILMKPVIIVIYSWALAKGRPP